MSHGNTLKVDSSGDLIYNNLNRLETVEGIEKVAQDIRIVLGTVKGSDLFHPEMGVDYFTIIQSSFNRKLIESQIRNALSGYPYLKTIDGIEISGPDSNRKLTANLRITAISGESVGVEVSL